MHLSCYKKKPNTENLTGVIKNRKTLKLCQDIKTERYAFDSFLYENGGPMVRVLAH